jgi:hypothetical protein
MKVRVTKLDAAKKQLETAIMLYFHDGDPVSIHTLCLQLYLGQVPPTRGILCFQFIEQHLGIFEVGGVEALGEPVVYIREHRTCLVATTEFR